MARGVNKAIIVGNLGRDPEVRYSPSGAAVANVSIATTEAWKDKNSGEQQEKTEWHRVVFFGKLAEIVGQYLKKGSQVYVEGRMETKKWQDQEGNDRYTHQVVARDMQMLGGRGGGSSNQDTGYDHASENQTAPSGGGGGSTDTGDTGFEDFDQDIPFITRHGIY